MGPLSEPVEQRLVVLHQPQSFGAPFTQAWQSIHLGQSAETGAAPTKSNVASTPKLRSGRIVYFFYLLGTELILGYNNTRHRNQMEVFELKQGRDWSAHSFVKSRKVGSHQELSG